MEYFRFSDVAYNEILGSAAIYWSLKRGQQVVYCDSIKNLNDSYRNLNTLITHKFTIVNDDEPIMYKGVIIQEVSFLQFTHKDHHFNILNNSAICLN